MGIDTETIKLTLKEEVNMEERRCDVCGKRKSELEKFGKEFGVELSDAVLVSVLRPLGPCREEVKKAAEEAEKIRDQLPYEELCSFTYDSWFSSRYGEEEGKNMALELQAWTTEGYVWHCRDCALLDEDQYFVKRDETEARERGQVDTSDLTK